MNFIFLIVIVFVYAYIRIVNIGKLHKISKTLLNIMLVSALLNVFYPVLLFIIISLSIALFVVTLSHTQSTISNHTYK
ncbi:MAG: hypothetical protein RSC93_00800 [Erysipelotrichaceae bacterium]